MSSRRGGRRAGRRDEFRSLLEYAPEPVLIAGADGRILRANRMLSDLVGYAEAELIGQPVELLVPEDRRERHVEHRKAFVASARTPPMGSAWQLAVRHRDGTRIPVEISLKPIRRGRETLMCCVFRDLRERKRTEAELRRFRLAMDSSGDSIYLTDPAAMRFVDVNAEACRRLGYSREQLLGMGPQDVLEADRGKLAREYDEVIAAGERGTVAERIFVRRDGTRGWTQLYRRALRADGGWVIVTVGRDITDRKRVEQALRESEERFQKIFHHAPEDMTLVRPEDGVLLDVNEAFERSTGYRREEALGRTSLELGLWADPDQREPIFRALARERRLSNVEFTLHRRDGALRASLLDGAAFEIGGERRYLFIARDVSERKRAEQALRVSEAQLRLVVDNVPAMITYVDRECRYRYANRIFLDFYNHGHPVQGMTLRELLGEEVWQEIRASVEHTLAGERTSYHRVHRLPDGSVRQLEIYRVPHRDGAGAVIGFYTMIVDVTERLRAEEALRLRTRAIEASLNSIAITAPSAEGQIALYVNPAFERMTGYSAEEVLGRSLRFLHGEDEQQPGVQALHRAVREGREAEVLVRDRRKDGTEFWNELRVAPVRGAAGRIVNYIAVGNDVTERVRYQEQLEHHANHDSLTGLPNRNLLADRLAQALAHAARSGSLTAVLFIDVDALKRINDGFGHAAGDQVIAAVGRRLAAALRATDTVARVGGDEFVVVLPELHSEGDAAAMAEKLRAVIAEPLSVERHEFLLSASVGIALCPKDGKEVETLLRNADTALNRAKEQGRNCFRFFAPEMNSRAVARMELERALRHALEAGEFCLEYQPIVELATGSLIGAEALLRWRRAAGPIVAPGDFISVAEETGLIVPIGRWVMQTAARDAARWNGPGRKSLVVSVNLSARQFRDPQLVPAMRTALAGASVDPAHLMFEITESTVMENAEEAIATLHALRGLGVALSVDDFGTGYSSLSYLKRFPLDTLKIDREFVRDLPEDRDDLAICRSVIGLAHALGLRVVAEGIETRAQAETLTAEGCDLGQGYLFGRAMPPEEFVARLKTS